ncbi:replication-relaxation family protein [Spirillospora sp. NBC_00431]
MTRNDVAELLLHLSERDRAVLEALRAHRLLTTALIRRLYFVHGEGERHSSQAAASGAAMRVLSRLESRGLVIRLQRRIGGVRAGSSGIVWQLGARGERLLRSVHGETARRRYLEPSAAFITHTLAVAELATQLQELDRRGVLELVAVESEPSCWRSFLAAHGTRAWLKPDLFTITAAGDYEDHYFIELDQATEHPGVVLRKAAIYQQYAATGAHQAEHGVFPAVLWVVPDERRVRVLKTALAAGQGIQPELFRVITAANFAAHLTASPADEDGR